MITKHKIGLPCILALSLAACGSNDLADDAGTTPPPPVADAAIPPAGADAAVVPGSDAAVLPGPDSGTPPTTDPYIWVVIQDTEQVACSTTGPGSDIDAVAKLDATGKPLGWGRKTTAAYTPNPKGYACDNVDCAKGNCKYAANSSTFTQADLVARTEGPADATVGSGTADDTGYFSLNAGALSIQIGDITGGGIGQELKSGDWIAVYEVDKTYIDSKAAPASCSCLPEHYTVSLQSASGAKILPLTPRTLSDSNTTCAALTATSTEGCGTTVFGVP
jgi:hypothetical protein